MCIFSLQSTALRATIALASLQEKVLSGNRRVDTEDESGIGGKSSGSEITKIEKVT